MKIRIILAVVMAVAVGVGVVSAEDQMIIKLKSGGVATFSLADIDTIKFDDDTTLVAHYPFNGNADDASGNGLNGTVHGATLTADRFGIANRAYHFSAQDSAYISVEDNDLLDVREGEDFAISIWMRTTVQDLEIVAVSKYSGGSGPQLFVDTSGTARIWARDPNPRGWHGGVDFHNGPVNDGEWHMLTGMRRRSVWTIWVDGRQTGEIDEQSMGSLANGTILVFGCSNFGNFPMNAYWEGELDDISIYRRALTEAEIQGLFNQR